MAGCDRVSATNRFVGTYKFVQLAVLPPCEQDLFGLAMQEETIILNLWCEHKGEGLLRQLAGWNKEKKEEREVKNAPSLSFSRSHLRLGADTSARQWHPCEREIEISKNAQWHPCKKERNIFSFKIQSFNLSDDGRWGWRRQISTQPVASKRMQMQVIWLTTYLWWWWWWIQIQRILL